ncbi:MAG: FISUMP domain-containing protein [Bacteroidota bacterium]
MAQKKLFIVQYSEELDKFQLLEVDDPQLLPNFEIPIIDAPHQSNIRLSSHFIDTEKVQCSFPNAQIFPNPHNAVVAPVGYGLLYNFHTVASPNFAPAGWHVPTDEELSLLVSNLGGAAIAGGSLKEIGFEHWAEPNTEATNETGFSFPGGGYRSLSGAFRMLTYHGFIWTLSEYSETNSIAKYFSFNFGTVSTSNYSKNRAASVRLIKDDDIDPESLIDIDGNIYDTVKIGDQVWLAANWKCTKYNNGSDIPNITDGTEWAALETPGYCAYNNDLAIV